MISKRSAGCTWIPSLTSRPLLSRWRRVMTSAGALERKWPADRRHFAHAGHLCEVTELDRPLVEAAGADILTIGWTGSAAAIREHRELAASQGITEVAYAPMGPDIPSELDDFAAAFLGE